MYMKVPMRIPRVCVCVCVLLLLLKSVTCTLVQTGRFLAATGYVAPSPSP